MGHEVMTLLRQMWSMSGSTTKWGDFFSLWSGVKLGGQCCNTVDDMQIEIVTEKRGRSQRSELPSPMIFEIYY